MKVRIVYVHPTLGGDHYLNLAVRFLKTYHEHPPGMDHETIVVCNGQAATEETAFLFGSLPNLQFLHHDNSGYDIGAYQLASATFPDCDMMVFFGASTYLKGTNWLARMVQAFTKHGNALYGIMANRGVKSHGVYPHIRTTGFFISPALFNQYPLKVTDPSHRYPAEHGPNCITSWVYKQKLKAWLVYWSGEYPEPLWDTPENGYHRGNQSDLLAGDRNSSPPYYHCE